MRYRITHRTQYVYETPAHESFNEVRLRPVSDRRQACLAFDLTIDPPATVIAFEDYYGNAVHDFSVPYMHLGLIVEATSEVVTFAAADEPLSGPRAGEPDRSPALATLAGDTEFADEHAEYLTSSAYVSLGGAAAAMARSLLAADPSTSAYGFLMAANAHIHDTFDYQIGATSVHTTVDEVIAGRRGVCQDFSHLLIALGRNAGLPMRYASGYLGQSGESEASHAWVEAFIPPWGWIGVDPAGGAVCTGRHVKVATGRDYADVSVVRGTYRGGLAPELSVNVRCEELSEDWGASALAGPERRQSGMIQFQTLGGQRSRQLDALARAYEQAQKVSPAMQSSWSDAGPRGAEDAPRQQPQQQQQQQQQHRQRPCSPEQDAAS